MENRVQIITRLIKEEEAATAVEYAMIVGLIALVAFTAFRRLGFQVERIIREMAIKMQVHIRG